MNEQVECSWLGLCWHSCWTPAWLSKHLHASIVQVNAALSLWTVEFQAIAPCWWFQWVLLDWNSALAVDAAAFYTLWRFPMESTAKFYYVFRVRLSIQIKINSINSMKSKYHVKQSHSLIGNLLQVFQMLFQHQQQNASMCGSYVFLQFNCTLRQAMVQCFNVFIVFEYIFR